MILLDGVNYNNIDTGIKFNAGSKAHEDIKKILNLETVYCINKNGSKLSKIFQVLQARNKILNMDVLVQYPLKMNKWYCSLLKFSENSVCLIHDINGLRENDTQKVEGEISFLNKFKTIIAHNAHMRDWLINNGYTGRIVELEIFDYLTEAKYCTDTDYSGDKFNVAFAGNLEKSGFLKYLDQVPSSNIIWKLFGAGEFQIGSRNVQHCGKFSPDIPPLELAECHFGLVWDGDSIRCCEGKVGRYLKYNNPHKCSLYLAMGMPVIIWKQAAMADFIQKNHCGIIIESLDNLDSVLNKISQQEYGLLKTNALNISKKLRSGKYTIKALDKCMN